MKKWIPLALLTLLGGCWFDNAPEIYQVTYKFTETGGRSVSSGAVICDYRGQTATRDCAFSVDIPNEHLSIVGTKAYADDVKSVFSDPKFRDNENFKQFQSHKIMTLKLDLSAHGRKEDRYNLSVSGLFPWHAKNNFTAQNETGQEVMIVTDSDLRSGITLNLIPAPDEYVEHLSSSYNDKFNRMFTCYNGDPNGCKIIPFLHIAVTEPFKPATLSITWMPIDEDQIPAAGSGQTS